MISFSKILRGVSKKSAGATPVINRLYRPAFRGFAAVLKGDGSAMADTPVASFATNSSWATRRKTSMRLW
jgi:hypothetical protein